MGVGRQVGTETCFTCRANAKYGTPGSGSYDATASVVSSNNRLLKQLVARSHNASLISFKDGWVGGYLYFTYKMRNTNA